MTTIEFIEDFVKGFSKADIKYPSLENAKEVLRNHYYGEVNNNCRHSFLKSGQIILKAEKLGINTDKLIEWHDYEHEKKYHEVKEDLIRQSKNQN